MRSVPGGGWKNSEGKKKVWRAAGWFAEYSAASPKYQMREKSSDRSPAARERTYPSERYGRIVLGSHVGGLAALWKRGAHSVGLRDSLAAHQPGDAFRDFGIAPVCAMRTERFLPRIYSPVFNLAEHGRIKVLAQRNRIVGIVEIYPFHV